jgi:hypothetical protein
MAMAEEQREKRGREFVGFRPGALDRVIRLITVTTMDRAVLEAIADMLKDGDCDGHARAIINATSLEGLSACARPRSGSWTGSILRTEGPTARINETMVRMAYRSTVWIRNYFRSRPLIPAAWTT